jgi:predicted enzyme related to lactoylglutathione lyase
MAGKMVHCEVPSGDTARARGFWGGLFGWEFQDFQGPIEYHMAQIDEGSGVAIHPGEGGGLRLYFDVDDIGASAEQVRALGGEAADAMPVPEMGWFAHCKDTEGNQFGLWQTDSSAAMPE